ncbi:uncharacterized protein LOC133193700 [Saccostrea echinata]|uniref:uncharacterized protein LOC133193700 n=1 Tax=Saccostrea echinata TaxID=191078 RepID=UPI002A82CBF1|nr:uncharacterized protein LOC133193700 [Saccostrea echinata]
MGIQRVSESVFVELLYIVGTSQEVIMRREIVDIRDTMLNQVKLTIEDRAMTSGSRREGFRLKGSDVDYMFWPTDHTVIWNLNQVQNYDLNRKTLILCDCSESPPGFALLQLLTSTQKESVKYACIRINSRLYISSSKYRKITRSALFPNSKEHGPCGSGVVVGGDYDHAECFVCDFWPPPASKWIDRCHSWPHSYIVDDIVRNGCHFVAIGHKLGKHADKEWRISFSLAEQKLVYSMNHCQFLTYGLLKLFLKESINDGLSDEDKSLCSYHMKTAVFWVIQQNILPQWHPQNILECFWICFKIILKWVYEGVCPNFFIPENNMFLSSIHGEAQKNLFIRLHELYEKGIVSLLHIPSIESKITSVLQNPRQSVGTDEHILISKVSFAIDLFNELHHIILPTPVLHKCIRFFNAVEKLIILPLTQNQVLLLQRLTASILQKTAFMLYKLLTVFAPLKINSSSVINKQVYMTNKTSSNMLKLAAKFGCISDMLYIAMFYYKTLRYKEALLAIEMTKVKLAKPNVMYVSHLSNDILCYRHVDPIRAQTTLDILQFLVHHDQGMYIEIHKRDISWQILGICQQVTGNHQAALYSYQQALRHTSHNIQTAALMRIQEIMGLMHRNH